MQSIQSLKNYNVIYQNPIIIYYNDSPFVKAQKKFLQCESVADSNLREHL